MHRDPTEVLEMEIEAELMSDDGSATRAMLTAGRAVHIRRDDTPSGHVIRILPGGSEEIVRVDREALAALLG